MTSVSDFVLNQRGCQRHSIGNCQYYPKPIFPQVYGLPHVCLESASDSYIFGPGTHSARLPKYERQTRRAKDDKPDYRVHIDLHDVYDNRS